MAKVMHDKVREFKQKAAPITYSSINITQQGKLNDSLLDKGIVEGYSIIWGMKSLTGLKFLKGCCSRSIKEHGPGSNANYELKFLNQHNTDDPLSLYESLVEDDIGLRFRTKPLDLWDMEGSSAHRVITQLRSRTLNNFSHGFDCLKTVW
jgi:HK97 family phage prohead protease